MPLLYGNQFSGNGIGAAYRGMFEKPERRYQERTWRSQPRVPASVGSSRSASNDNACGRRYPDGPAWGTAYQGMMQGNMARDQGRGRASGTPSYLSTSRNSTDPSYLSGSSSSRSRLSSGYGSGTRSTLCSTNPSYSSGGSSIPPGSFADSTRATRGSRSTLYSTNPSYSSKISPLRPQSFADSTRATLGSRTSIFGNNRAKATTSSTAIPNPSQSRNGGGFGQPRNRGWKSSFF